MTDDAVPPQVRDRFDVGEELGRGSTGVLFRATEKETDIVGVLKVLHAEVVSPRERMRMTRDLARQASLANVHLAVPVATGEAGGRVWVFRRWVEGESVRVLLDREGPLEQGVALGIAGQVASALDELHRTGLLHRDVKPEHIIRNPAGSVVLIDAGVTSAIPTAGLLEVRGTPAYVSPEHATGKVVSFRSDLYGLGCLLFELLTGAPPFTGDTPADVLRMQAEEPPPPPPDGLPDKVESLLTSLLAKSPRERPFSANNVAKVLSPFVPAELRVRASSVGVTGYHPATLPGTGAAPRSAPEPSGGSSAGGEASPRAGSLPPPPPDASVRPESLPPPAPEPGPRPESLPPPPPPEASARPGSLPPPPPMPAPSARAERGDATVPLALEQILSTERADPTQEVTGSQILSRGESTQPVALEQIVGEEAAPARSVPPPAPEEARRPAQPVGDWPVPDATQPMAAIPVAPAPSRFGPLALRLGLGVAALLLLGILYSAFGSDEEAPPPTASAPTTSAPSASAAPTPAAAPTGSTPPTAAPAPAAEASSVGEVPTEDADPAAAAETAQDEASPTDGEAEDAPTEATAEAQGEGEPAEAAPTERRSRRRAARGRRSRSSSRGRATAARSQGEAHLRAGRNRQAEAAYRRAVRQNPRDAQAWVGLGAARIRQGDARGAVQAYQRAVRLRPNNSNYFTYLGRANARAGNRRAARQAYRRALSLNPRNRAAKRGLDRL